MSVSDHNPMPLKMADNAAAELFEPENLSIDSLTDELLAHCFSFLDAKDLSKVEIVCSRFKRCVENGKLWAAKCSNLFPTLAHLLDDIETSELEQEWPRYRGKRAMQLSAACKRLFSSLAASSKPDRYSLLSDPCGVSSQDHLEEHLGRTLSPQVRGRNNLFCYWSSRGSEDEDSEEWVAYRLCHPLCVVSSIQIRPFKAWFQGHSPIYSPKRITVGLGGLSLPDLPNPTGSYTIGYPVKKSIGTLNAQRFQTIAEERRKTEKEDGVGSYKGGIKKTAADWVTLTKEHPILQEDTLQTVHLPPQTLCVGGYLQLNLLGRTQQQEADDQYYTCLGYVKAQGAPIYNFRLISRATDELITDPPRTADSYLEHKNVRVDQLKLHVVDPLRRIGGLKEWSEHHRCAEYNREHAREANQPDPLDDYSGSEIGSEDMDLDVDEFDELDGIL